MNPVSVIVPTLGPGLSGKLLEHSLPPLLAELERRGGVDELLLVDDSGLDKLRAWTDEHFPDAPLQVVPRQTNGGFARALSTGIEQASHSLAFAMNSDVLVRPGFLEPLIARIAEPRVFAVVPQVLIDGHEGQVESLVRLCRHSGRLRVEQPALHGHACAHHAPVNLVRGGPVPFAVGGAFLFRPRDFTALGGFDPLYEPFYLEDLDLCWRAWGRGARVVLEPESTVEHHHRATIGAIAPPGLVRAAIEKNLLLFQWKHQDDPAALVAHLDDLLARAITAHVEDRREELVWLALALDQVREALAQREPDKGAATFAGILEASGGGGA